MPAVEADFFYAIGVLVLHLDNHVAESLLDKQPGEEATAEWHPWPTIHKPSPQPKAGTTSLLYALQFACSCGVAYAEFRVSLQVEQTKHVSGTTQLDPDEVDIIGEDPRSVDEESLTPAGSTDTRVIVRLYLCPEDVDGRRRMSSMSQSKARNCRKFVLELLHHVDTSSEAWNGSNVKNSLSGGLYAYEPIQVRLTDVYAQMPSPSPYTLDERADLDDVALLADCINHTAPYGIRTELFTYQKHTLWKLLQRELVPERVLDPDLVEFREASQHRRPYWLRISTGQIYKDPIFYEEARGGIICEDMGTGKTCICIALVLSTRYQIAQPPVDCVGWTVKVELDPQWLRLVDGDAVDPVAHHQAIPSLKSLAARSILINRVPFRYKKHLLSPPLYKLLRSSATYYLKEGPQSSRASRSGPGLPPIKILLSSSTLVVVPDTLVDQWRFELNKHLEDRVMNVCVITDTKTPIPSASELVKYDMILMSHQRFGHEYQRTGGFSLDGNEQYRSPLVEVRWLRLLVDEGHVMAREGSSQVSMAAKLECERRWVCTGTPMPNILQDVAVEEQRDLQKLGSLLSSFLNVEPYASTKGIFKQVISGPFLQKGFRGYEKLRDLMNRLLVRNRREDIERDVKLPPLAEKIVLLDFSRHQRLVHNGLLSLIRANAVLSQREHQDYFFHPTQQKALREVLYNLFSSCFWYAGRTFMTTLSSTLENVREGLRKAESRGYSKDDICQLESVENALCEALNDELWLHIIGAEEVVYEIAHCPEVLGVKAIARSFDSALRDDLYLLHAKDIESYIKKWKAEAAADISPSQRLQTDNSAIFQVPDGASLDGLDYMESSPQRDDETIKVTERDPRNFPEMLSTSSTKLTYLAHELVKHAPQEKIIIFAQYTTEIYYLHEVCRLAKIRCILFHKQMRVTERAQSITTFNTSDNAPVIIMETRLAAWGIDLSSASRVYFVSPVWQHDMERQAIKRAHRIGAKKPVYVETLVIRGTIEEDIVRVRTEKATNGSLQAKMMMHDSKMRNLLSAAKLLGEAAPFDTTPSEMPQISMSRFPRLRVPITLTPRKQAVDYYADAEVDLSKPMLRQDGDDVGAAPSMKRKRQESHGGQTKHKVDITRRRVRFHEEVAM